MLRIWFFWTPHLSAQVLRDFIETSDMEVVFVVTGEDKAVGRHQVVTPNEVKTLAMEHNIPVHQPARVRGNSELFSILAAYDADYFVVVAYGKILPTELLHMPKRKAHLLPWQGEMSRHGETEGLIRSSVAGSNPPSSAATDSSPLLRGAWHTPLSGEQDDLPPTGSDSPSLRGAGEIPCLNIHGSILPKYRGASPIQSALLEWERETGVTIMTMSEGMDEGDIVDILTFPIAPDETAGTLFEKYGEVSGQFAIDTIRKLDAGILAPKPQDNTLATYCTKIHKEDGLVDWSMGADTIYHRWQGFTPWPGIFTMYEGKRLVIEKCGYIPPSPTTTPFSVIPSSPHPNPLPEGEGIKSVDSPLPLGEGLGVRAGTVIRLADKSVGVICWKWILTLKRVKLEWKKSQSVEEFVNGQRGFISSVLS